MQVVWNAYLALSYGHPFVLKQVFYWLLHAAKLITLNSAMSGTWEMFDQMNLRKPKLETWFWVGAGIKVFFYVSPNKEVATKWCWDICRWFISHQLFLYWSLVPLVEEQISRWYYCSNFFCTSTNLSQLQIVCERYKIFLFPSTTIGISIQPNERYQMK